MGWILRLVKTGADGGGQSTDVVEINKPDDLGDIAHLGLSLDEAKLLLAALQQDIVAAQVMVHAVRRSACRCCGGPCHVKDCHVRFQGFWTQSPTGYFRPGCRL